MVHCDSFSMALRVPCRRAALQHGHVRCSSSFCFSCCSLAQLSCLSPSRRAHLKPRGLPGADRGSCRGSPLAAAAQVRSAGQRCSVTTRQVDLDAHFAYVGEEILRGGYAWVGVSAQAAGIDSAAGSGDLGPGALGLKAWDPARYAELSHPGDAYSYAIFSDVGAVLRHRSPDTTAHYAKVDVTMLRQVAQPWPGDA